MAQGNDQYLARIIGCEEDLAVVCKDATCKILVCNHGNYTTAVCRLCDTDCTARSGIAAFALSTNVLSQPMATATNTQKRVIGHKVIVARN